MRCNVNDTKKINKLKIYFVKEHIIQYFTIHSLSTGFYSQFFVGFFCHSLGEI